MERIRSWTMPSSLSEKPGMTDYGPNTHSHNIPAFVEGIRSFPGAGIDVDNWPGLILKGIRLIPEHRPLALFISNSPAWFILTAGSLGFLIWNLARGTPAPARLGLLWVLITALFGPLGLLAYVHLDGRPQRASDRKVKMIN